MYIVMENVNNLIMSEVGSTYQMELARIFDGQEPTDRFLIKYSDAESEEKICEKCGEVVTDGHECGEPTVMTEEQVEKIILKEFNEAQPGRVLLINKGEFEDPEEFILVQKR